MLFSVLAPQNLSKMSEARAVSGDTFRLGSIFVATICYNPPQGMIRLLRSRVITEEEENWVYPYHALHALAAFFLLRVLLLALICLLTRMPLSCHFGKKELWLILATHKILTVLFKAYRPRLIRCSNEMSRGVEERVIVNVWIWSEAAQQLLETED